jgi:hypothetical protein
MTSKKAGWALVLAVLLALPAVAQLQTRDNRYPENPPVGYGYGQNYIPDGTRMVVVLQDKLETNKIHQGKHFTAKLAEDLVAPDGSSIPAGKKVHGHVSEVSGGMRGKMLLSFDEIETRHGWRPFSATVIGLPSEHGVKTSGDEGEIQKTTSKKRVAETTLGGAAVGAATGAAAGGAHGAIIGAGAGAAVGAGAGLLTDRNLKLDKKTQLEVRLDRPLQVPR